MYFINKSLSNFGKAFMEIQSAVCGGWRIEFIVPKNWTKKVRCAIIYKEFGYIRN